jgi:hypothetical protein
MKNINYSLFQNAPAEAARCLRDTPFLTAAEKTLILRDWTSFLKNKCSRTTFTKRLYHHLTLHCDFIAHYSIHGFYEYYFERPAATIVFLRQFTTGAACEGFGKLWLTGDCADLNEEMCRAAQQSAPRLIDELKYADKRRDIATARRLLSKHGIELNEVKLCS